MDVLLINLIIAVLLFFPVRWLCRKWYPSNKIAPWVATLFLTPVVYVGCILIWIACETYYPKHEFNRTSWESKEIRYQFADDLVDNEKLIGRTKEEVKEMLGSADRENENTLTYYLGFSPRHFINIDPDWLDVEFKDSKAVKAVIYNS